MLRNSPEGPPPHQAEIQKQVQDSSVDLLKEMIFGTAPKPRTTRKNLQVLAGRSVSLDKCEID